MGNGSTWPENYYRNEHAHTQSSWVKWSNSLTHTELGSIITSKQIYLFNPRKDNTVMIFTLFLPKVKCLITSKQMASTHPNLRKISCHMENTSIYMCLNAAQKECSMLAKHSTCFTGYHACVMYDNVHIWSFFSHWLLYLRTASHIIMFFPLHFKEDNAAKM